MLHGGIWAQSLGCPRASVREGDVQISVHRHDQRDAVVVVVAHHLVHMEKKHVLFPAPP